jgi:4-amino-4-deoxy-L-arabinose transferase-like glycosyltransferase
LAAPLQIWVVDHIYSGVADWVRYDNQGASFASSYRHFDFSVPGGQRLLGDGMVSAITAGVFAIIGINQVGAFLIFSFAAWIGLLFFYRAFSLTFAGANHRRYAILLFFLPSLIFWTADVSKEAIMTLSLGLASFGAAKILARRRGGFVLLIIGGGIGALVRPNELLLLLGGFCIALLILPAGPRRTLGGVRRVGAIAFLSVLLGVSVYLTFHFLRSSGGSFSLQQISTTNKGSNGAGFGSSDVTYSPGPQGFLHDVFTVLFDPLGYNAHSNGERLASVENLVILGVILSSWRQLRIVVRASFARPYVLLCGIYSAGFIYTFAALGNLGLITRERTLLFPFFLVILSIPLSPKGEERQFDWEVRRRERLRRRRTGKTAVLVPTLGGIPSAPRPRPFRPTSLPIAQPVRAINRPAPPEDPTEDPESPTTDPPRPTD